MSGLVSQGARGKVGLGQEGFPVPELNIVNVVVVIIGMGILRSQLHLHFELLSLARVCVANNNRCMSVEIIFTNLFLFLAYIDCCKYAWHATVC